MKKKLSAKTAAVAAFISLIQVAQAETSTHSFTPLEDLPPEARQQIVEQLNELAKHMQIDWEQIAVGINENGELTLILKKDANLRPTGSPSSFGMSATESPKKKDCE